MSLADACLYLVVIVGAIALICLLALFVSFVWKVSKALKLSKPSARCPKCNNPLPSIPTAAVVNDETTSFLFTCSHCQHKLAIKAEQPDV